MPLEQALTILRSGSRVIKRLCEDTGLNRTSVDLIITGKTLNPSYETALKIIKWVEEN